MTHNDYDRPTGPARQGPGQGRNPAARRRRTSPFDRVEQPPPKKKHPGQPGFVRRAVSEHQWTASAPAVTRHLACLQSCASSGHAGRAAMFWMPASSAAARNAPLPSRPFAQTSPTAVALRFDVIPTRPAFDLQRVQMKDGLQAALTLRGSQRDSPVQHICAKRGSSELIAPPDLGQCAVPERIRTWSAISPAV